MKYKVQYEIVGYDNVKETKEYDFYHEAQSHKDDIAGFEGVYNCKIVEIDETERH